MSTITTLNDGITGASFRSQVNTNFSNLNTDKLESTNLKTVNGNSLVGSGDIVISGGGSVATDSIWDAKGDLAVGTGANTASRLAVGTNGQVLTADSAEVTGLKWANPAGGGDALTSGTLAQFASTTSSQLAGVISDETGTGSLVFANSPSLITPSLGAATATSINGATITSGTLNGSVTGTNTGDQTSIVGITGTLAQFNTACTDADLARTDAANTFTGTQTITQIDLGNTDTSITRLSAGQAGVEGVRVKLTTPLVVSAASYTTDTGTSLNMDNLDMFIVTAQAGALLFNAPGGTLVQGRQLIIRIKDNGTARALTWNAVFRAMGTALPSTTVLGKTLYLGFIYNSTDTRWDLIASGQEA